MARRFVYPCEEAVFSGVSGYPMAGGGNQNGSGLQGSETINQEISVPAVVPRRSASLGLRLIQTPSFIKDLEMKLDREKAEWEEKVKYFQSQQKFAKLKASNIPATSIQIGSWTQVTTFKGDIVAKFYFARRKFVWEVLNNGLKNKMEMSWDDVRAIKATFNEGQPDNLKIQLKQQPQFFYESSVQAKMHTLWDACDDFTRGQALRYRTHLIIFPEGTLAEQYENLIYNERRFYLLNQVSFPTINSQLDDIFPDQVIPQQNPSQIPQVIGPSYMLMDNNYRPIISTNASIIPGNEFWGAMENQRQELPMGPCDTLALNLHHRRVILDCIINSVLNEGVSVSQATNGFNSRSDRECSFDYLNSLLAPGVSNQTEEGFNSMNLGEQNSISVASDYNQDDEASPCPERRNADE